MYVRLMSGWVGSGLEAADLSPLGLESGTSHPCDTYVCTVRVIRVAELGQD